MNIRIMTANDYDAVYALWMSCIGMGLNTIDDSKEGITKFLIRNPEICFVAESGEKIIGVLYQRYSLSKMSHHTYQISGIVFSDLYSCTYPA